MQIPKVSAEFVAHMEDVLDLYASLGPSQNGGLLRRTQLLPIPVRPCQRPR